MFPPRIISRGPVHHLSITIKTLHQISFSWKGDQDIISHLRHYMPCTNPGWDSAQNTGFRQKRWTHDNLPTQCTLCRAGTQSELPELQLVEMIPEGGHKLNRQHLWEQLNSPAQPPLPAFRAELQLVIPVNTLCSLATISHSTNISSDCSIQRGVFLQTCYLNSKAFSKGKDSVILIFTYMWLQEILPIFHNKKKKIWFLYFKWRILRAASPSSSQMGWLHTAVTQVWGFGKKRLQCKTQPIQNMTYQASFSSLLEGKE